MPREARLAQVKDLVVAHVAALTIGAGNQAVTCTDGFAENNGGDPYCHISWPPSEIDTWAGSGGIRDRIYMPTLWFESTKEDYVLLCLEEASELWQPGSANMTALGAVGVRELLPKKEYPVNPVNGTLHRFIGGLTFRLRIRYS